MNVLSELSYSGKVHSYRLKYFKPKIKLFEFLFPMHHLGPNWMAENGIFLRCTYHRNFGTNCLVMIHTLTNAYESIFYTVKLTNVQVRPSTYTF